jgi:hypothetical protein
MPSLLTTLLLTDVAKDAEFDEGQHPRDDHGRWTSADGGRMTSDGIGASARARVADHMRAIAGQPGAKPPASLVARVGDHMRAVAAQGAGVPSGLSPSAQQRVREYRSAAGLPPGVKISPSLLNDIVHQRGAWAASGAAKPPASAPLMPDRGSVIPAFDKPQRGAGATSEPLIVPGQRADIGTPVGFNRFKPAAAPAKAPGSSVDRLYNELAGASGPVGGQRSLGFGNPSTGMHIEGAAPGGFIHVPPGQLTPQESHLQTARVTTDDRTDGGINETHFVTFEDGTRAVFKPQDGASEERNRSYIEPGQDMEREAGAWEVAKRVGMEDMVPPTVIRTMDGRVGSMQEFVPDSTNAFQSLEPYDGSKDFARAAIFDTVIGNKDRHMGNWMVNENTGKLALIDHGLAFPEAVENDDVQTFAAKASPDYMQGAPAVVGTPADYAAPYVEHKFEILNALEGLHLPLRAVQSVGLRIDQLAKLELPQDWGRIRSGDLYRVPYA